jgi:hypothetical protein
MARETDKTNEAVERTFYGRLEAKLKLALPVKNLLIVCGNI